jgi:hypothetical protein
VLETGPWTFALIAIDAMRKCPGPPTDAIRVVTLRGAGKVFSAACANTWAGSRRTLSPIAQPDGLKMGAQNGYQRRGAIPTPGRPW